MNAIIALIAATKQYIIDNCLAVAGGMTPCLKQSVYAVAITTTGEAFFGSNWMTTPDITECPRVAAKCATGEGYDLCAKICGQGVEMHAERMALNAMMDAGYSPVNAHVFITGHTYCCDSCILAMLECGVEYAASLDSGHASIPLPNDNYLTETLAQLIQNKQERTTPMHDVSYMFPNDPTLMELRAEIARLDAIDATKLTVKETTMQVLHVTAPYVSTCSGEEDEYEVVRLVVGNKYYDYSITKDVDRMIAHMEEHKCDPAAIINALEYLGQYEKADTYMSLDFDNAEPYMVWSRTPMYKEVHCYPNGQTNFTDIYHDDNGQLYSYSDYQEFVYNIYNEPATIKRTRTHIEGYTYKNIWGELKGILNGSYTAIERVPLILPDFEPTDLDNLDF